ncbi:MAG TPA: hypothetical protein VK172_11365 [Lentimicrobium sp.]|nr:hypothetical protein [Lentimicrobium sp.]
MKTITTIVLFLMCTPAMGETDHFTQLIQERQNLLKDYQSLIDSVGISPSVKMKLLSEKLNSITTIEDSLILYSSYESAKAKDSISVLNSKLSGYLFENERLQVRTKNDLSMIMILKLSIVVFLLVILILIYFLVTKSSKKKLLLELNEKITQLEAEKEDFNQEVIRLKAINSTFIINELHDERDKLLSEVNQLKSQLEEAKTKNKSIIQKIDKLITDLSGVHS